MRNCEECDALFLDHVDVTICDVCAEEYWKDWCEECGADPDQPCADDCENKTKARCLQNAND